jgi:hypothetical protein
MEHYITLFDSLFLPQGLALHSSLERYAGSYTLWVLCMDEEAKIVLDQLQKPNIKTIALSEVETPELLTVKAGRSKREYCWTLTPFTPHIVFERDKFIQRVTYIDADLFFLNDVTPIFEEFEASGKAVLMTEHAYADDYDFSKVAGQFCVQFMTFIRELSEPVRSWWQEKCLEWCFARIEDGKFGDQKYLEQWPQKFPDLVHILTHQEWMLGPWNALKFPHRSGRVYHFHQLRIFNTQYVDIGGYMLPKVFLKEIYYSYLKSLRKAMEDIQSLGYPVRPQTKMREQIRISIFSFSRKILKGKSMSIMKF